MSIPNSTVTTLGCYNLLRKIGSGSFASVYLCEHTITHYRFAGKLFNLEYTNSEAGTRMIRNEVSILQKLCSPKVIRFEEVIYTTLGALVVIELVKGRNLLDFMPFIGGIPECFARQIFGQIIEALFFLHCNGIVHRDLKLENVMIQQDGDIKLIDFGLATYVSEPTRREGLLVQSQCGTPHYYAPEMILAGNNEMFEGDMIDIWAAGVILYSLVAGSYPFSDDSDSTEETFRQIVNEEVTYGSKFSTELENLLRRIFMNDPAKRISLHEIRSHPWTNNTALSITDEGWVQHNDTISLSISSRSRALHTLSLESDGQFTGPQDNNLIPRAYANETRRKPKPEARSILSLTGRAYLAELIEREQIPCPDTMQGGDGRESSKRSRNLEIGSKSVNDQEAELHDGVRKSFPESSRNMLRRFSRKRLKHCLKILSRKKGTSDSCGSDEISETETADSVLNDENRNPLSSGHRRCPRDLVTDFDSEERRIGCNEPSGPFCTVSFRCWKSA